MYTNTHTDTRTHLGVSNVLFSLSLANTLVEASTHNVVENLSCLSQLRDMGVAYFFKNMVYKTDRDIGCRQGLQ